MVNDHAADLKKTPDPFRRFRWVGIVSPPYHHPASPLLFKEFP